VLRNALGVACWLTDSRIPLAATTLRFSPPPHADSYRVLFDGPTTFNAPVNSLQFDAGYLQLPVRRDEAALQRMLQRALLLTVRPYRRDRLLVEKVRQTLADPFGGRADEEAKLQAMPPRSIREFDSAVTAPRWGFADVEAYYREASPLQHLVPACKAMPPTLLLQALDDPWVPASSAMDLAEALPPEAAIRTLFTPRGGHNGFHGRDGCWGDQLAAAWLRDVVAG